jgi:hypothetical protein
MKRRFAALACGLLGMAIAIAGGLAVPASAASAAHAGVSTSQTALMPAAPAATERFVTLYVPGGEDPYLCIPENKSWPFPATPVEVVVNDCPVRVRLYEYVGNGGWDYCISPGAVVTIPSNRAHPNELYIGTSNLPCVIA